MLKDFIRNAIGYSANKHLGPVVTVIDAQTAAIYNIMLAVSEYCTVACDDKHIFFTYDLSQFDAGYLRFTFPRSEFDKEDQPPSRDYILWHLFSVISVVQSALALEAVNGDLEVVTRLNCVAGEFDGLARAISPDEIGIREAYYRLSNPTPYPNTFEVTLDRETGLIRAGKVEGQFTTWVSFAHAPKSKSGDVYYGMLVAMGRGTAVIPFKSYEDSEDLKMRLYAITA